MNNPLLNIINLPYFTLIKPEHIEPAINLILKENKRQLEFLLNSTKHYTWENLIQKIEDMDDRLNYTWSTICHLHSVIDSKELRKAYNACLSKISDYATEKGQNKKLFCAYQYISQQDDYNLLNISQKKIIDNTLRDFHLTGISLGEKKARYKKIEQKLSKLQTKFEENLLDATDAWSKLIKDKALLSGLPESVLNLASQTAKDNKQDGWLFTLDFPSYHPVMQYADNEMLRKEIYTAYITRASEKNSDNGKYDNSKVMMEILRYRTEKAKMLGFKSYADYSLATKMADNPKQVIDFLNDLAKKSKKIAKAEYTELSKFAKQTANIKKLNAWDIPYYSEKLRKAKFDISQEALRPYFSLDRVLQGLFTIVKKLYGINIVQRKEFETWHKDVCFFDIYDKKEKLCGGFYMDLYARRNKRAGAWMGECVVRKKKNGKIQHPVAYLVCNFTPKVKGSPSLLTHDDVITLFHEFGHGLHHMLTKVDYSGVSGINGVPWDAVEFPSQFMENWAWERKALDLFARHIKTNELIDDELFNKINSARLFQSGMGMLRQLEFAIFDFRLHLEFAENNLLNIQSLLDEIRKEIAVLPYLSCNRFQHSFSHIFAGGYAAGYYSYKWAEVLAADAFSKFQEKGIFDKPTGQKFLEIILENGGSADPMELFIKFRGRKPNIEALLQQSGIKA